MSETVDIAWLLTCLRGQDQRVCAEAEAYLEWIVKQYEQNLKQCEKR